MAETGVGNQIFAQGLYRCAHKLLVLFLDAAHDAALPAELRAVGDGDMTDKAGLAAHHAVLAEMCRSAHTHLGCQSRVLTHFHIVGKMNQVVEFHSLMNPCRAHRGAVDGGVGPDFHIVVNHHIAHLRNLLVMAAPMTQPSPTYPCG